MRPPWRVSQCVAFLGVVCDVAFTIARTFRSAICAVQRGEGLARRPHRGGGTRVARFSSSGGHRRIGVRACGDASDSTYRSEARLQLVRESGFVRRTMLRWCLLRDTRTTIAGTPLRAVAASYRSAQGRADHREQRVVATGSAHRGSGPKPVSRDSSAGSRRRRSRATVSTKRTWGPIHEIAARMN